MKMKIKIGLPKGRLLSDAIYALKKAGFDFSDALKESRKLVFKDKNGLSEAIVIRAVDLLTYVEYGAVDLGIIGYDLVLEQRRDIITVMAFNFGRCHLSIAEPVKSNVMKLAAAGYQASLSGIRVGTKYPYLAYKYFNEKGYQADIIKLYGAIELAPLYGLSDIIVDLVSTGETLKANGLVEREHIIQSSARLVANKASLRLNETVIQNVIEKLKKVS